MVLYELKRDDALLVSPGGRVRVLAPRGPPDPTKRRVGKPEDAPDYIWLPGYKVKADFPPSRIVPVLFAHGFVDANNFDEMHEVILKVEAREKRRATKARRLSDYAGMDFTDHFLSNPEHGGSFWMLARGVDGGCTVRSDPMGRHPVLYHRVAHSEFAASMGDDVVEGENLCDWLFAPATHPRSKWPSTTDGWKHHHPRHIIRVDPDTAALCPCHATAGGKHDRLLPLLPPRVDPPPSLRLPVEPWDDVKIPAQYRPARPFELPLRLTEDGVEEENEGMLEAARELTTGLVAAVKSAAWAAGASARAPVGVLFSGGVDSVAVLACCLKLDIPVVAATAAFTGSLAEPSDLTPARTAAAAMGARLLVEEVNTTDEAAAALARIAPAVYGMDVVKAGVALTTYFAAKACAAEGCCAVFSGGGSEELFAGYARHAARPEDEKGLGLSGLRSMYHRDLQRDHAAAGLWGLAVYHPFLSSYVAPVAYRFPGRMKILPANSPKRGSGLEKRVLRVALERHPLAVDRSLTRRPKCAAQYGSRFHVALRKVAKRLGFGIGRLAEAVAACAEIDPEAIERAAEARQRPELPGAPPFPSFSRPGPGPPPARFALLYTSGHNSAAAFHTALLQRRRCCVVVPFSSSTAAMAEHTVGARHSADLVPDPDEPHTANLRAAAERFADATGLPLWNHGVPGYTSRTRFLKSEREAASAMATAMVRLRRDYGLLGVVVGHARDLSALLAAEAAAEVAGLRCIAPCWGAPRASELLLSCRGGAESMLVVRAAPHALGAVLRDPAEVRALADQMGGEDAVDGDAPGAPLDMIPCEAAFYGDRAVVRAEGKEGGGGTGTTEVVWENVSVVDAPRPPPRVRDVVGRARNESPPEDEDEE